MRDVGGEDKKARAETIPWDQGGFFFSACWFLLPMTDTFFILCKLVLLSMLLMFKTKDKIGGVYQQDEACTFFNLATWLLESSQTLNKQLV